MAGADDDAVIAPFEGLRHVVLAPGAAMIASACQTSKRAWLLAPRGELISIV